MAAENPNIPDGAEDSSVNHATSDNFIILLVSKVWSDIGVIACEKACRLMV